jgi:hypothetical protein
VGALEIRPKARAIFEEALSCELRRLKLRIYLDLATLQRAQFCLQRRCAALQALRHIGGVLQQDCLNIHAAILVHSE